MANSNLIARQTIESVLIQNNVVNWAYTVTGLKEKRPVKNLRAIASLYQKPYKS